MKTLVKVFVVVLFISFLAENASAQCAMCSATAEHSVHNGNTEGNSLNSGILYLLATPYLLIAVVGYVWYKKYRRKDVVLDMKDEKIHLN
ncbi:MAG TPA: hypothetical protein VGD90_04455 [Sphingobacteriaceae bacterium]